MGKIAKTGNDVVDRIKETASEKGISLKFICEKVGMGKTYFSDVVNGSGIIPDDRLDTIAEILHTSKGYILTGEQKEKATSENGDGLDEVLERLRTRPECRMLFKLADGATASDVEKAAAIIEALRKVEEK